MAKEFGEMGELFGSQHDLVKGLKKAAAALALGHEFLFRVTEEDDEGGCSDDVWELNKDAFAGLGHVLFELRYALVEMRQNLMREIMDREAEAYAVRAEKISLPEAPKPKTGDEAVLWLRNQMIEKLDQAIDESGPSIDAMGDILVLLGEAKKLRGVGGADNPKLKLV